MQRELLSVWSTQIRWAHRHRRDEHEQKRRPHGRDIRTFAALRLFEHCARVLLWFA